MQHGCNTPTGFPDTPPTKADAEGIVELLTTDANTVDYLHYTVNDLLAHWQTLDFNKDTNAWIVLTPQEQVIGYAFNAFYKRGQRKVGLDVNAENQTGAIQLYQHAGMQRIKEFYTYEKELSPGT
jgi:hypothetical protein